MRFLKDKYGQSWGIDLTVAIMLFAIAIVVFYVYSINYTGESKENFEDLFYEGKMITGSILSEGSPLDWNSGNVVKIGVLTNEKINETKLERFYDLTQNNYQKTKEIFDTRYDYYFFLDENMIIDSLEVEGIGKPGTNLDTLNPKNLIKITRVIIYEDKPVNAYLYIWEN